MAAEDPKLGHNPAMAEGSDLLPFQALPGALLRRGIAEQHAVAPAAAGLRRGKARGGDLSTFSSAPMIS